MQEKINKSYRISYLLAQYLNGKLDGKNLDELQNWLDSDDNNRKLLVELQEYKNVEERDALLQNINIETEWDKFSTQVGYNQFTLKTKFIRLARYAAALLIPLMVAWMVITINRVDDARVSAVPVEVTPGTQGAKLVLSNGNVIKLGQGQDRIKEQDGTMISTDSLSVSYQTNEIEEVDKLIYNEIKVDQGQEFKMQLADGTMVWLNSMSSIKFPVQFSKATREVEITGEVYFEVQHNPLKPFIVHTPVHDVKVLGTSFNISCYANDGNVKTTLVDGKVLIDNINGELKSAELSPNQQYSYNKSEQKASVKSVNTSSYVAWTNGYFHFENESLEQIFKKLERWYDMDVFYKNRASRNEVFTGRLPRFQNASTIINMIEAVSEVEISMEDNLVIIN